MKRSTMILCAVVAAGLFLGGCDDDERYNTDAPSFASGYQSDGTSNGISSPVANQGYSAGTNDFHVGNSGYGYAVSKKPVKQEDGWFDGWFDWM